MPAPSESIEERKIQSGSLIPIYLADSNPDGNPYPVSVPQFRHIVSTLNSTSSILGANGIFTGTGEDVLGYTNLVITMHSDVASAVGGLEFQFSFNNIDWFLADEYTYDSAGVSKTYTIQRQARYFRIIYTNGSTPQSDFDLSVICNTVGGLHSSHRIGDMITNEDDAQVVKSVLSGMRPDGDQTNINATFGGSIRANVTNSAGVLPVAQLITLHDGKILNRLYPEMNEIVGTGTGTLQTNKYNMAVAAGQYLIHRTRRFLPYFSGKPQKVEVTFDNFAPQVGVTKRVGYFSSATTAPYDTVYDGFYLESSNGSIRFVMMRSGTVVYSDDISTWSRYTALGEYQNLATWDNFTVVEFDFLWLGGAFIEFAVQTQFGSVIVHQRIYAGTAQDTFTTYPNQPVRYEIRSSGGAGSFRYICNQVATSGSINESGISKSVNTGVTAVAISTTGIKYPILALRIQSALRHNTVKLSTIHGNVVSNDLILWTLEINPTLSAPLTYNNVPNSAGAVAIGNGVITVTAPGTILVSGYLSQDGVLHPEVLKNNFMSWLGSSITGVTDEYVVCATTLSPTTNVVASIVYLEA